jgi:hypothetical protein
MLARAEHKLLLIIENTKKSLPDGCQYFSLLFTRLSFNMAVVAEDGRRRAD